MSNTITNRQIIFILILTLTTFGVITISKNMAETAGLGSWLTILITTIIFAVGAALIVRLNTKYEGKMIFDYSSKLIGKFGAYVLSIYYVLYFGMIIVFLVTRLSTILKNDFLYNTPTQITMLIGIPIYCYIAYKGITNVARLFEFIGLIFIITGSSVHLLMLTQSEITNILPLFTRQDIGEYLGALKETIFPFLGIEVLLIIPFTRENGKKAIKTSIITLLGIGLFYILIVESCIMKLGLHEIVHYDDALIAAIRDMEVPLLDFFQRMDFLYLTVGFLGTYMGITIVFTAIIELLCKVFPRAKRITITIIVGILTYLLCLLAIGKEEYSKFVLGVGLYLGLVAAFGIPIILLIVSKVRKHM